MTDLHADPFILSARANLLALEDEKDRLFNEARDKPRDVVVQIAYDAALTRWAHAKVEYQTMLKSVLGL